ncbi:hypothetical protein M408DRAFT_28580 [Serendipita vermifera MAFF 305830]|uniref:Uncharacterized protein n=1 Tax=Serendipita vermifera MAFF 305830 TaxID=933852 RepID=A0A0C3ATL3_SERVB|nr:hypothetical protein M408DRAFT_28580 [Serendipita vermifera MAFF 305830]
MALHGKEVKAKEGTKSSGVTSPMSSATDRGCIIEPYRSGRTLDPLALIPPEISWKFILEALPPPGDIHHRSYTAVLVQFTTVSQKWQNVILSSSPLWSELHVDTLDNDLLASISVSAHFSSAARLEVVIWNHPEIDWQAICRILQHHSRRIYRLAFKTRDPQRFDTYEAELAEKLLLARAFMEPLGHLFSLTEIDFGRRFEVNSGQLASLDLPPNARITSDISNTLTDEDAGISFLSRFTSIYAGRRLDHIVPALTSLVSAKCLFFPGIIAPITDPDPPHITGVPPQLQSFIHPHPYCSNVARLIRLAGSHLRYINLKVPDSKLFELINALRFLVRLESLSLDLVSSGALVLPYSEVPVKDAITSLRSLEIYFETSIQLTRVDGAESSTHVLQVFSSLYPSVTNAVFEDLMASALPLLERFENLRTLSLSCVYVDDDASQSWPEHRSLAMPSLFNLVVGDPQVIQTLDMPNLLSLRFGGLLSSKELTALHLQNLRSLEIRPNEEIYFQLDASEFRCLQELKIRAPKVLNLSPFPSFPSLQSIALDSQYPMNHNGNRLCAVFIENPETCPSLQQVHFADFVEWDIVFLMLQRRNLGEVKSKRIHTVTIPFVPFSFRDAFTALLFGRHSQLPSGRELSPEDTREILCDPTIPGCVACLRNRRLFCSKKVEQVQSWKPVYLMEMPFSQGHKLPDSVPADIKVWAAQRLQWVDQWNASFKHFQAHFMREYRCERYSSTYNSFNPGYISLV